LKTVGQIAGLAGLALGVVLIIYRDVLRKSIFPKLDQGQAYSVIRLVLVLTWLIALAGLGAWLYTAQGDQHSRRENSVWLDAAQAVEKHWKEAPRQDLVRTVVSLRDSMTGCQAMYLLYKKTKEEGRQSVSEVWHKEWRFSLDKVIESLYQLDRVLSIFSSETQRLLREYKSVDAAAYAGLEGLAPIDIKSEELGSTFERALRELDRFIRNNFTQEEIFAAGR
jgi:hypothetical protein